MIEMMHEIHIKVMTVDLKNTDRAHRKQLIVRNKSSHINEDSSDRLQTSKNEFERAWQNFRIGLNHVEN